MNEDARLTLTVNGEERAAAKGELLLNVLRRLDIDVPTLCHDERLTPYGGCRLCVVARKDGRGGLVPACSTPVEPGMVIDTDAPEIADARRRQLQLLLMDHRMECPVCERNGDCRLQELVYTYGTPQDQLPFDRLRAPIDERSPLIVRDAEKCVLCGKCARLCEEVQGVGEITLTRRGLGARIETFQDRTLDCEFCGQCVDACPVGALVARPFAGGAPVWMRDRVETTCSWCSCGCQLEVESHGGKLQRVTSSTVSEPNRGNLCVKGRFGWDVLSAPDRLTSPLLRRAGRLVPVSWEEAVAAAGAALDDARTRRRAVVGCASPRLTSLDAYLFQRLIRGALGSPHVSLGPSAGVAALAEGAGRVLGRPCSTASFDDLRKAATVLVVRADPTRTHPLIKTELVQGVSRRGQRLVLAHALSGGLERFAEPFLALNPGSEEALLNGLSHLLVEVAGDAARRRVGFEKFRREVGAWGPETVSTITGVPVAALHDLASILAGSRTLVGVVVTAAGLAGDEASTTRALAHLLLLLEHEEGEGNGLLVLGEKANLQGAFDAGVDPGFLPGWRCAADPRSAEELAALWGTQVLEGCGWDHWQAMQRAAAGEVGVMYLVGHDPVDTWARGEGARAGIEGADFVIVQAPFLTETARAADLVLPVSLLIERSGFVTSADGVRRELRAALSPPDSLPSDGAIFAELSRRVGLAPPEHDVLDAELEKLLSERPSATPAFQEVGAPSSTASRTPATLLDPSPQLFHSGATTMHSRVLQLLSPAAALHVSREDAVKIGAGSGELVRVTSGDREVLMRIRVDRRARSGAAGALWSTDRVCGAGLVQEDGSPTVIEIRRS